MPSPLSPSGSFEASPPAPPLLPLHAALLRRSVGALAAREHRCEHCGRTPLLGERVYLYETGEQPEALVCELCRARRREAPARSEEVRVPRAARAVRVRSRAA